VAIAIFHFDFDLAYQQIARSSQSKTSAFFMELQYLKSLLVGFRNLQKLLEKDVQLRKYFYSLDSEQNSKFLEGLLEDQSNEKLSVNEKHVLSKQGDLLKSSSDAYLEQILSLGPSLISGNKCLRYHIIKNTLSFLRSMCSEAYFTEPYLKAVGNFLSSENFQKSSSILNDTSISFFDRLGFALRFFHNDTLKGFFNKYIAKA